MCTVFSLPASSLIRAKILSLTFGGLKYGRLKKRSKIEFCNKFHKSKRYRRIWTMNLKCKTQNMVKVNKTVISSFNAQKLYYWIKRFKILLVNKQVSTILGNMLFRLIPNKWIFALNLFPILRENLHLHLFRWDLHTLNTLQLQLSPWRCENIIHNTQQIC